MIRSRSRSQINASDGAESAHYIDVVDEVAMDGSAQRLYRCVDPMIGPTRGRLPRKPSVARFDMSRSKKQQLRGITTAVVAFNLLIFVLLAFFTTFRMLAARRNDARSGTDTGGRGGSEDDDDESMTHNNVQLLRQSAFRILDVFPVHREADEEGRAEGGDETVVITASEAAGGRARTVKQDDDDDHDDNSEESADTSSRVVIPPQVSSSSLPPRQDRDGGDG